MRLTKNLYETVSKIERYIEEYEKIVIFDCGSLQDKEILEHFLAYVSKKGICRSMLIIAAECSESKAINLASKTNIIFLSQREINDFLEIYNMYEFSNKIILITDKCQYPSLLNYLSTGVLTENEFFEAIMQ